MTWFNKGVISLFLFTFALASAQSGPIRVGSKQFTESLVTAKLIIKALENAG